MVGFHISQSVGIDGKNTPQDIKSVQKALNELIHLIAPTNKLIVDGSLGTKPERSQTVAAIKLFQKKVVMMQRPDGRVDVNGHTHRKIKEKLLNTQPSTQKTETFATTVSWMKTAFSEVGQAEVDGSKANPRILEYFKASKFWGTDDSGGKNAWCGSFVAWVVKQNGYEPVKNAFRAREWESFGKKIEKPIHGAIGIKSRKGGGHVAFVVGKSHDDKYLYMLGGNQGNKVSVTRYLAEVWDTFVIPSDYDFHMGTLPIYTKDATIAGSEV
ncbi:TIGR02594 family protein [Vibrio vulnificus]|uniref:NlpC/P60 family protein n=1 Tax=Vibrio vulnificus TaxID=672 RepID=UPI001F0497E0|nr:TIGR02594 family protein [Vibrio vulnificus]EJL7832769.1 TIGR02594 family protein [Vibrio vulnificus]MCG9655645.1 TIGR02594 family protein [Vibrio vulnificus]